MSHQSEEQSIIHQLTPSPTHYSLIATTINLPAHRVLAILTVLELKRLALHVGGGRFIQP